MDLNCQDHVADGGAVSSSRELLDLRLTVQVGLAVDDVRAVPSSTTEDRVVIAARAGDMTVNITPDTAIRLANQLTDAVDQLERSDQP